MTIPKRNSDDLSRLARDLKPYLAGWFGYTAAQATASSGSSGGGSLTSHALNSSWHTGILAESQAPWAVTDTEFFAHTNNVDAHHTMMHDFFSPLHHAATGNPWELVSFPTTNILGKITPSSDTRSGTEAVLKSASGGGLSLSGLNIGTGATTAVALSGVNNAATTPDILFTDTGVIAAQQSLYIGLDSTNTSTARTLIIGKNAATSGMDELVRIDEAGAVTVSAKVRVPLIDSATSIDMTIAPGGDLYLSPVGLDTIVQQTTAFRSHNYLKTFPLAGFRIGPTSRAGWTSLESGSGEFDELRARIFVADETRVDRGQEYITKSYGILSRDFSAPTSVGQVADLYVENSPHIAGAVFSNGDWLMLRYLDMSSGIILTSVWGTVASYSVAGLTGEQKWVFTLQAGTPANVNDPYIFRKGALAVNFGQSGQGYLLSDAVTGTAPFFQIGRWVGSNPYTPANISVITQIGKLDGVGFTGEYGIASSVSGFTDAGAWFKITTSEARLNNIPIRMWNSGTQTGQWSANGSLDIGFNGIATESTKDFTINVTGYARLGRETVNYPNLYYSSTSGYLAVRSGTTDKIRLNSDGSSFFAGIMEIGLNGEIRQGTGTVGIDYTGLRIWSQSVSGGRIGRIAGYGGQASGSQVIQWEANTTGEIRAGNNTVAIAHSGVSLKAYQLNAGNYAAQTDNQRAVTWWADIDNRTGVPVGKVFANTAPTGGLKALELEVVPDGTGGNPSIWLQSDRHLWFNNFLSFNGIPGIFPSRGTVGGASTVQFYGSLKYQSSMERDSNYAAVDIGTASVPFRTLYVDNIIASTITGGTQLTGQIWQFDPSDMYIRSNSADTHTLYVTNPGTGLLNLNVDGSIIVGGTVDGVEVGGFKSAYDAHIITYNSHVASVNAHHAQAHAYDSADHTGTLSWIKVNKTGSSLADIATRPHSALTGIGANDHHSQAHAYDSTDHTGTLSWAKVNKTGSNLTEITTRQHAALTDVTADQHHAQIHNIAGTDHIASGTSVYQVLGIPSSVNSIGWMTPSATPGAHTLVKTDASSGVTLVNLTTTNAILANGGVDYGTDVLSEDINYLNVTGAKPVSFGQVIRSTGWNISTAGIAALAQVNFGTINVSEDASYLNFTTASGAKSVRFGQTIRAAGWNITTVGGVTATSAVLSGNVQIIGGGDLSVAGSGEYAGVQVLFVDSSGGNVGVNCVPDSQFALDVAGPLRASILYGPHGLILKNVLLLAHYDGRQPYTGNFSGEPNGHMGQTATTIGGVIFRPGKFNKSVQLAGATTNLLLNPSFETNLTNWTATGTGTGGAATRTDVRSYAGDISVRLTAANGGNYLVRSNQISLAVGASVAVQCRLWRSANISAELQIRDVTNGNTRVVASPVQIDEWELLTAIWTNTTSGTVTVEMRVSNTHADGTAFVWLDACQMELSTYATPYCDGSLGGYSTTGVANGTAHAWTGTEHASTSTRLAAMLSYPTTGNIDQRKWTIMAWVCLAGLTSFNHEILRITGTTAGHIILRLDSLGRPQAWSGTAAITATSVLTPGVWTHIAATYDGTTVRIYYNGLEVASGISSGFDGMPASMFVGRSSAANQYLNGWIDDLVILSQAETAAKIRAVVESDAPVAAEVSRYVFRATPKGLVWGDDEGLWVRDAAGNDTFGIYGGEAATKSWGGLSLGVGDVLIGRGSDYMHWDSNLGTMNFSGNGAGITSINGGNITTGTINTDRLSVANLAEIAGTLVVGTSNKLWLNDGEDGQLAIGGMVKDNARFRVTAAGALIATQADIEGEITASSGSITGTLTIGAAGKITAGHVTIAANGIGLNAVGGKFTSATATWWQNNTRFFSIGTEVDLGSPIGAFIETAAGVPLKINAPGGILITGTLSVASGAAIYDIWHAGNFSPGSYAPLSGAAFTGSVTISGGGSGFSIFKRTGGADGAWTAYNPDGSYRLYYSASSGSGDRFTLDSAGSGVFSGNVTASNAILASGGLYSNAAISVLTPAGQAQQVRAASILASSDYNHNTRVPANGIYSLGGIAIATPETITSGYVLDVNGATRFRGGIAMNAHANLSPIAEPATSAVTGIFWMGLDNKLYFKKPSGTAILVAG